jgi:glyoxylase-like metal-dependent hydrolase (beta-lactamase superfamily II)
LSGWRAWRAKRTAQLIETLIDSVGDEGGHKAKLQLEWEENTMASHFSFASICMAGFLIAGGGSAAAGAEATPDIGITVRRLSPRTAVFNAGPWDNAVVAIATQKGIVVVDSGFSKTIAKAHREAIQAEFKRSDFAFLINTHEHADHMFGDSAYSDIPLIGSEALRAAILKMKADPAIVARFMEWPEKNLGFLRQYLAKNNPKALESQQFAQVERFWKAVEIDNPAGADLILPAITFDHRMTLNLGDVSAGLFSFELFHSMADILISVPEENLVLTEAVFSPGRLPHVISTDSNEERVTAEMLTAEIVNNWIAVLHEVLNHADEKTQFLGCHGRAIMNKAQCAHEAAYLEKLWSEVRRTKAAGKTLEQAQAALGRAESFAEFADLGDVLNAGTPDEVPSIHRRNIESLWKAAP